MVNHIVSCYDTGNLHITMESVRCKYMSEAFKKEIKLFYCYAREDKILRDELELHLSGLKRYYHLINWHDREILPGEEWEKAIDAHLDTSHLILLLISPNFMASDYCYGKEMKRALERHREGNCCVIPILIRPVHLEKESFSNLQMLPTDAKAITRWPNRDEAFADTAKGISAAVKKVLDSLKTKEEWLEEGNGLRELNQPEKALNAYEQALRLDSTFARAYNAKGNALRDLKRYHEALAAYEQATHFDPSYTYAYHNKGNVLRDIERFDEALAAYEQTIALAPDYAYAYHNKGNTLRDLRRFDEALVAYEQAIQIDSNFARPHHGKGLALYALGRYNEALYAYEQAIHLDPHYTYAYRNKSNTLRRLGRVKEADRALAKARQLGFSG